MNCRKCHKAIPDDSKFCNFCGAKQEPPKRKRGNHQGTVYMRGNSYVAEVTLYQFSGGRVRKRKCGFKTKTEALDYIPVLKKAAEEELHNGRVSREEVTLSTLWKFYQKTTVDDMNHDLKNKYLKAWSRLDAIKDIPVKELLLDDLQECVYGLSHEQAKYPKKIMKDLFDLAVVQGVVSVNIAKYVKIKKEESKETPPFTIEELDKIWNAWDEGNAFCGYVLTMIYTGMMPCELREATWSMVDFESRTIRGAGKKTEVRKKSPIVFADILIPVLQEMKEQSDSLLICPLSKDVFYRRFSKCMAECGCRPLNPYSCRHTTGTAMADVNVNPLRMQKVMRHAKIETTMRYVHEDAQFAREGIDELKRPS